MKEVSHSDNKMAKITPEKHYDVDSREATTLVVR